MASAIQNKVLEIAAILDESYTKNHLEQGMKKYAQKFFTKSRSLLLKEGMEDNFLELIQKRKNNKNNLANLCALPFASKTTFEAYKKILPREIVVILEVLIREGLIEDKAIEERFGLNIASDEKNTFYHYNQEYLGVKPAYRFFTVVPIKENNWSYHIFGYALALVVPLRKVLSEYYPRPKEADFIPLREAPPAEYIFTDGEETILTELPRIIAYYGQQQIRTTKKNRPVLTTIPKMQRQLGIEEFFPGKKDKVLKNLRTALLAGLIVHYQNKKPPNDPALLLKKSLFENVFLSPGYSSAPTVLHYLKGIGKLEIHNFYEIESQLFDFFGSFPVSGWIDFKNVYLYIHYNFLRFVPFAPYHAQQHLYYEYSDPDDYYDNRHYLNGTDYKYGILRSYLQGIFFYTAAWGLFDIAYDAPDVSELGRTAYSPYDELKGVRLTALGAYVFNKSANYEPPELHADFNFKLSENSFTILVDNESITADNILAPFTKKVSPQRYKTDFSFFLKDCRSKNDLDNKINLFKQSLNTELPENWQAFFRELRQKIDPLEIIDDIKVFKIPGDNTELMRKIARDEVLQKYIIKAEDFHLLVYKKHIGQLKKRLKEFGYLLTR